MRALLRSLRRTRCPICAAASWLLRPPDEPVCRFANLTDVETANDE